MKVTTRFFVFVGVIAVALGALVACDNPLLGTVRSAVTQAQLGAGPQLLSITPAIDSTDVPTSIAVTLVFDAAIDVASVSAQTVKLVKLPGETEIAFVVSESNESKTITLTPASRLERATGYRVDVTTGVKSAAGATFAVDTSFPFVTRYYHDDDIGIDLSYSSDTFALSAVSPIYVEAYPVPLAYPIDFGSIVVLEANKITTAGKFAIPQSALPGTSGQVMLRFFHDLDNSYVGDSDSQDSNDSVLWFNSNEPGNLIDEDSATIIEIDAGAPVVVNDAYVIMPGYTASVGSGYAVSFSDTSTVSADGFETGDGLGPASSRVLALATTESARNLHALDDVDYFRFTPSTTDRYEIRIVASSFQLRVALYDNDSDATIENSPLATSTDTAARILNPGGTILSGGSEYYLRVESPTGGLGSYGLGYFFTPVSADTHEDNDSIGTATVLAFGRSNAQVDHTAEAGDLDYFEIDIVDGQNYVIEVTEDPTYFSGGTAARSLEVDFVLYDSGGSSIHPAYAIEMQENTFFITDPGAGGQPAGTYFLEITNATPQVGGEFETPTAAYSITFTYGPDVHDELNNPYTGENEYDLWNEHAPGANTIAAEVQAGTAGFERSIYSSEVGINPEDDVDWFRIRVHNNLTYYMMYTEPIAGTDGIITEFDLYLSTGDPLVPDASVVKASGQMWSGSADEPVRGTTIYPGGITGVYTEYPVLYSSETTFYVRVVRSTTSATNPLTGGYRFVFKVGADSLDDGVPDYAETVDLVEYRIDETPWIGQPNSSNLETRNKLADVNDWLSGSTPRLFRSLYTRDYDFSTGKPDGVTDTTTDYEWVWVEIPPGVTSIDLLVLAVYENWPVGMPIKASVYKIPNTASTTALDTIRDADVDANEVLTVSELGTAVGTYDSDAYFTLNGDHQIYQTNIPAAAGEVFFFKIERDSANAGAGDPKTMEYSIQVRQ